MAKAKRLISISKGKKSLSSKVARDRKKAGGSNIGRYSKVSAKNMAGKAGKAPAGSYPINTLKRAKSALKLAHNAPNPAGIKRAVLKKYPQLKQNKSVPRKTK